MTSLSKKSIMKDLLRGGSKMNIYERCRHMLAEVISADGDSSQADIFRETVSSIVSAHREDKLFPVDNRFPPQIVRAEFSSIESICEFTAIELLPVAERLREFEVMRERKMAVNMNIDEAVPLDDLFLFESKFGFSNWLSMQIVNSIEVVQRKKFLDDLYSGHKRSVLLYLPIVEQHRISTHAIPATEIWQHLLKTGWPKPIRALLALSLDPLPRMSLDELILGMKISTALPAIDRWLCLVRACQNATVLHEVTFQHNTRLHKLFEQVASVESCRLLDKMSIPHVAFVESEPSTIEKILHRILSTSDDLEGETVNTTSDFTAVIGQLFSDRNSRDAIGRIAVLDRQAALNNGFRQCSLLSALVVQLSAFSSVRLGGSVESMLLSLHPELDSVILNGNIANEVIVKSCHRNERGIAQGVMSALERSEFDDALSIALSGSYRGIEVISMKIDAYIGLGDAEKAVHAAAELITLFPWNVRRLPFADLVNLIPDEVSSNVEQAVYRTIVCDAALQHGFSTEEKRNDFFEDVLEISNATKPSDIEDALIDMLDINIVEYFYAIICSPEVMDTVPVGRSTEELLQERVHVLGGLLRIDNTNSSYEREVKSIVAAITTRQAMARLENQKVYVDTSGLKARLRNTLSADFERYLRFKSLDQNKTKLSELFKMLKDEFGGEMNVLELNDLMRALNSEADQTLRKIVTEIRREFCVGNEFGLDGYLSGGIRHGVLESHLRKPLVKNDLLGIFHKDGSFSAPNFASQIYGFLSQEVEYEEYLLLFKKFAEGFQEIVDEVVGEWVRIEFIESNHKAMFGLHLTSADVKFIGQITALCVDIDHFLQTSINYWWDRVDSCLASARTRIKVDLKKRLIALVKKLYSSLRSAGNQKVEVYLDNFIVPVYSDIDACIENLAGWFNRADSKLKEETEVDMAVIIAVNTVKALCPGVHFEWTIADLEPGIIIPGHRLKHWVDILLELFRNAAKYCGQSTCSIGYSISSVQNNGVSTCTIEVCNKISRPDGDFSDDDSRIFKAKQALCSDEKLRGTAVEGGSGLLKVWKYAKLDLRSDSADVSIERQYSTVFVRVVMTSIPSSEGREL